MILSSMAYPNLVHLCLTVPEILDGENWKIVYEMTASGRTEVASDVKFCPFNVSCDFVVLFRFIKLNVDFSRGILMWWQCFNHKCMGSTIHCSYIFNARAQRSWRRRLWHRPRTPSSSSSPSWRLQRWDTIRVRITKFGAEVMLDERCSRTKFDVTGYFRSPASGHFVNHFSNFSVQYLRNG